MSHLLYHNFPVTILMHSSIDKFKSIHISSSIWVTRMPVTYLCSFWAMYTVYNMADDASVVLHITLPLSDQWKSSIKPRLFALYLVGSFKGSTAIWYQNRKIVHYAKQMGQYYHISEFLSNRYNTIESPILSYTREMFAWFLLLLIVWKLPMLLYVHSVTSIIFNILSNVLANANLNFMLIFHSAFKYHIKS